MNQRKLKIKLEELVRAYFGSANVEWGRMKSVQAPSPLICLSMGGIRRPYQPITKSVNGVPINCYPSQTTVQVDLFTHGVVANNGDATTSAVENTAVSDLTGFVNFLNAVYADNWCETNDVSILANQVLDLTAIINDAAWECRAMAELEINFTETAVGYGSIGYEDGMPRYDDGAPKYDEDGVPLYPSGKPMYDGDGNTVDEGGNIITPPIDEDGNPVLPPVNPGGPPAFEPTPSGGGSQDLADQSTGWFEQVEKPTEQEEPSNG